MDTQQKYIGKLKEQIAMEHKARRNYPKKWKNLEEAKQMHKIYNENELNGYLKQDLKLQDLCPFTYTGHGDSYFVSKDMYNALLARCRCGRQRSEKHSIYCLQKAQNEHLMQAAARDGATKEEDIKFNMTTIHNGEEKNVKSEGPVNLPRTSSDFIGWQKRKPDYQQWEHSMKYVSPVYTMPGHKITAIPYNAIIIG